ncbi:hypothetical protein QDX25_06785 [Auritidibacter ignavus]|uniref:hypothetical protein n=1 Tax=Auritidibacter ignavus TaxID=678932 RepID=UPI002447CBEA|nr:hypothetical protein [Auritidibacter ignavus]WGH80534.1 hypothetical protein QDX25_06785 [Auritidibacter ignavus]
MYFYPGRTDKGVTVSHIPPVARQFSPQWAHALLQALEIDPRIEINSAQLHQISCEQHLQTAPEHLTLGFIAGYAAGLAEGSRQAEFPQAHRASLRYIARVLPEILATGSHNDGGTRS